MKIYNAIICDLIRQHDEHKTINEPFIRYANTLNGKFLLIISENSSSLICSSNLKVIKLKVSSTWIYRWLFVNIYILFLYLFSIFRSKKLIFLSLLPIHYLLLSILSNIPFLNTKFVVFMHGELGYINRSDNFGQKFGSFCLKIAFKTSNKLKVEFVAISLPIFSVLKSNYFKNSKNLTHIEYPPHVDLLNSNFSKLILNEDGLSIGSFGVLSKDKSSDKIYKLSTLMNNKSVNRLNLITIGLATYDFKYKLSENVLHYCAGRLNKDVVKWDIFSQHARSLDWALFFYDDKGKYGMTPSGVLNDCINWEIPIIGLQNSNFNLYFEKYGPLGILCDDLEGLCSAIIDIQSGKIKKDDFLINIRRAKEGMSQSNFDAVSMSLIF